MEKKRKQMHSVVPNVEKDKRHSVIVKVTIKLSRLEGQGVDCAGDSLKAFYHYQ